MNYILVLNLSNTPSAIDQQLDYIENTLGIPIVPQSLEAAIPYSRETPPIQTPNDWVEVTSQARHPAIIVEIATPIQFGRCPTQTIEATDTDMEWDAEDQTYLSIDSDMIQTLPRITRHVCWHHPSPSTRGSPSFLLFRGSPNYVGDSYGQEFAQTVEDMLREEDKNRSRARV
jgi:hypothetical protein